MTDSNDDSLPGTEDVQPISGGFRGSLRRAC